MAVSDTVNDSVEWQASLLPTAPKPPTAVSMFQAHCKRSATQPSHAPRGRSAEAGRAGSCLCYNRTSGTWVQEWWGEDLELVQRALLLDGPAFDYGDGGLATLPDPEGDNSSVLVRLTHGGYPCRRRRDGRGLGAAGGRTLRGQRLGPEGAVRCAHAGGAPRPAGRLGNRPLYDYRGGGGVAAEPSSSVTLSLCTIAHPL
jgi:hypothetical protein